MVAFDLPVAFHFSVGIVGSGVPVFDAAFQEVGGLEAEIEVETVVEGGENRFVHRLPKPVKHPNLTLKRGLAGPMSGLMVWCKATLENDFSEPIAPKAIVVSLNDAQGWPCASWSIDNAYPIKWSVAGFDAMKNALAIETIEFAYATLKRTL